MGARIRCAQSVAQAMPWDEGPRLHHGAKTAFYEGSQAKKPR